MVKMVKYNIYLISVLRFRFDWTEIRTETMNDGHTQSRSTDWRDTRSMEQILSLLLQMKDLNMDRTPLSIYS